jgi:hypothetical protein
MRSGVSTLRDYLQVVQRRKWIITVNNYRPYDRRQKEALR